MDKVEVSSPSAIAHLIASTPPPDNRGHPHRSPRRHTANARPEVPHSSPGMKHARRRRAEELGNSDVKLARPAGPTDQGRAGRGAAGGPSGAVSSAGYRS